MIKGLLIKKMGFFILSLGLVFALIGCNRSTGGDGNGKDKIIIGFSQHRIAGSDWYKQLIQGAKDEAKKNGVTLLVTDAGGDAVQQNSDIQNLLSRGAKGMIINALDPRGISGTVAQMDSDHIPFVAVNTRLSEDLEKKSFAFVAEDQIKTAAMAAEDLAKKIASKYGPDEKVKLAIIGGYSGESTTAIRLEGFKKGFNGYFDSHPGPKVEILPIRYGEWLPDKAREPMQQIATANPDLKAVFSMSDVMHSGIEQGLRDAGILDKVIIASYDGSMALVKKMIDNPTGPVQNTVANLPYVQGATAVQKVLDAINGKKNTCPDGLCYVDSILFTPENAKEYYDPTLSYYHAKDALDTIK